MFYLLLFLLVIAAFYYSLSKKSRKTTSPAEVTLATPALLAEHIAFFRNLDSEKQLQFAREVNEFLSNIKITGVDTTVTDIDRLLVGASAIIPIFSFPEWKYYNLQEVLLYSDAINMNFETTGSERDVLGMVGSGYMEGKMLLSKPALVLGFKNASDKQNTAIHEFVHLVDKMDGDTDGIPGLLLDKQFTLPWLDMIHQEMEAIKTGRSDINPYGYTNKSEFFAVAAEYFFERPELLERKHPALYRLLQEVFKKK